MPKKCLFVALVILLLLSFSSSNYAQNEAERIQYELTSIEFEGNNSIPSSALAEAIVSKQTPNWFFKFLNKFSESIGRKPLYFDSTKIPDDLASLKSYYRDNGFFNAMFSYNFKLDKDNKNAQLTYKINEGTRFLIRSFGYNGLDSLPKELIPKIKDYTIDSAKYYSKTLVEQNTIPFLSFLRDNGFMLCSIARPVVNIFPDSGYVDIRADVLLGLRYIIDSIGVEKRGVGRQKVEDDLIKKIVSISPGQYYSADEKQRAQVRLYRTNLFSSVLVSAITADTSGDRVPLNVTADIGPMNELSPEIILNNSNSAFNLGLGANYQKRNFLGEARTLTLSGNFAIQDFFKQGVIPHIPNFLLLGDTTVFGYLDLRASVEQPYVFNHRITGRLEAYWNENKQKDNKTVTYGSKLSFDFELPKFVYINSLQLYYSVERSVYDFQIDYVKRLFRDKFAGQKVNPDTINFRLDTKRQFTSILGADIAANKTNNLLFPTAGYNISLTLEEANLIPAILNFLGTNLSYISQFYRLQSTFTYYPNIYNSTTSAFGIKFKTGYLQAYAGDKSEVPLNKRFTAGGSNSVRGWRARELVPNRALNFSLLSSSVDLADYLLRDYPIGGRFLLEGSFETRNRLFGQFGSAVFMDYGNTWESYKDFSFNQLAIAFGFGFRYYSPFAPIRIDLGFKGYDPLSRQNFFKIIKGKHLFDIITLHLGIGEAF
ncbi:MAG: outer membrane protein assembly factor [Clostridiales bacterium]